MTRATDLAPWAHPKAKCWFHNLIEENSFALAMEDELVQAEAAKDLDKIRMIHAFALLLGREGIWPTHRHNVLQTCVRVASRIAKAVEAEPVRGPLTIAEHQGRSATDNELLKEIELLSRRLKLSNRKGPLSPPQSWGNLWE